MQPMQLLQAAWKFLSGQTMFKGIANEAMDKAMEAGKTSNSTSAVMDVLEGIAQNQGWGDRLNNQIWNSFRDKAPDDVIPHAWKMIQQQGILGNIISFLFPKKEG